MSSLDSRDIRVLLRLLGELRELGADPAAWRAHLAARLEQLCAADKVVLSELRVNTQPREQTTNCAEAVSALQMVDHGIDAGQRERFYRDLYFTDHTQDDVLGNIVPLYGTAFTILRADVVSDRKWNRSAFANERYRRFRCDDFVMSMAPVERLGVISSMELYRPAGRRFEDRERLLLALLHEELANDWNRDEDLDGVRLTPRQRQVLRLLVEGASEKEIAYQLAVSEHTAHDHVKALHRAFGARSRGELLARVSKATPPRTRLTAEGA